MLFNSYTFLFLFLPLVLAVSFVLALRSTPLAVAWLVLASFFFYGWGSARHVLLLAGSIAFNHALGEAIARRGGKAGGRAFVLLCVAVAANLAVLGWFKYAGFFIANTNALLGATMRVETIVLPLGISFFTFTQIAYLVDVYRQPVHYRLAPYALFVAYFPHLIAGPILHHRDMLPQFAAPASFRLDFMNLAAGVTLFAIGLFKKTVLADAIAPYVSPVFEQATRGYAPSSIEAWAAALSFGLQLYFDFSAYCDMAVGVSKMVGVRMPVNFDSPYKATSIIDFWRRWHMTLSRFLRDYVYIPLGGNRHGGFRRYANLMITMLLGGLWHGAAWTFVLWGTAHGAFLIVNHGWLALRSHLGPGPPWLSRIGSAAGAVLTFIAVYGAWVLFRADDVPSAVAILRGMGGFNGHALPQSWLIGIAEGARSIGHGRLLPPPLAEWVRGQFGSVDAAIPRGIGRYTSGDVLVSGTQLALIAGLLAIAWLLPNSRQIMMRAHAFLDDPRVSVRAARLVFRVDLQWAIASALLLSISLISMTRVSQFLYFRF